MGAMGPVIHQKMLDSYAKGGLTILDLAKISKQSDKKLPCTERLMCNLTSIGQTCLERAHLEAERRHCGTKSEFILGAEVELCDREKLATLLDPRTQRTVASGLRASYEKLLKEQYICYAKKANEVDEPESEPESQPESPREPQPPLRRTMMGSSWDDDDDEEEETAPRAVLRVDLDEKYGAEFDRSWKAYRKVSASAEWPSIYPELELEVPYDAFDLMGADLGRFFNILKTEDQDGSKYGHLPYMATHSRGSVGSLLASSFVERINSAANLIVTKGNTLLDPEEINMCTVLRMNRGYMKYMRLHHPRSSGQQFNMTTISNTPE